MKKRIIYYLVLVLFVGGFLFFNYTSVQKCENIVIESVTADDKSIEVNGRLESDYRSVKSVKTEKIGDSFYIKIEAVNDFFGAKPEFSVYIPNKKNNVEKVYLADKDTSTEIFLNSNFQKADN